MDKKPTQWDVDNWKAVTRQILDYYPDVAAWTVKQWADHLQGIKGEKSCYDCLYERKGKCQKREMKEIPADVWQRGCSMWDGVPF